MTAAIRYPLNRIHLALVVWCDKTDSYGGPASMERFVRKVGESVGVRESCLFVPVDHVTGWAWIPLPSDVASGAVVQIRTLAESTPEAPFIAVGNPLPGVDGFRRSHRLAKDAYTVAITSRTTPRRVTAAGDPGLTLAALLGENVEAAAAWVGEVLGPLASATDSDDRLRETLRVFLRTGSSYTAAAEQLYLHFNSVKYRVQRAIERRGRPITDDRCDVEVALILCYWLGTAVLS
ncbi:MAG: PucR family transcriptional regulator [Mycobacterium sp.]